MSPFKAVKPSKLSGLDGTCAVVDLTDGRSISETKSFWALYREFLLRRFAGAVFLTQKDDDLFFLKIAFLNDSISLFHPLLSAKRNFQKDKPKRPTFRLKSEPWKLQQCNLSSPLKGHSCFVFPWKKRHKLLRRNFRYTHNPHATSQQHGATRMRYCSRLKREFHNHGLSLKQFSGLAFAIRSWCLAPSLLCLFWVFSQGFAAGVHPKVLGFPHFNGFLINCLPVPRIWRGADFCALHADLCQWGDGCCAL